MTLRLLRALLNDIPFVRTLVLYGGLLLLFYLTASILAPLYVGLLIAFIIMMANKRFKKATRIDMRWLLFGLFMLLYIGSAAIGLPLITSNIARFATDMAQLYQNTFNGLDLALWLEQSSLPPEVHSIVRVAFEEWTEWVANYGPGAVTWLLDVSRTSVASLAQVALYWVLVPMFVGFLLQYDIAILRWAQRTFLLGHRKHLHLVARVWRRFSRGMGAYAYGKVIEIAIVALVTYIGLLFFDLKYAFLLSVLTGLSTLLPYIGAFVVALPVAAAGLIQWGIGPELLYLMIFYMILQFLDGNVLAPVLFARVVDINPLATLTGVLFFGHFFGVVGAFLTIPLLVFFYQWWLVMGYRIHLIQRQIQAANQ